MFIPNEDMVASSLKFDKAGVVDFYMLQKAFTEALSSRGNLQFCHMPGAYDPVQRSPPLRALKEIGLRDMRSRLNHSWYGRVVYGKFCVDPIMRLVLGTVFEDRNGDAVAVSVTNFGDADPSAQKFRKDQMVALKQPRLQQNDDGRYALKVNNPDDVQIVSSFPAQPAAESSDTGGGGAPQASKDPADALRNEGNFYFNPGDMKRAIDLYTQSIASLKTMPKAKVSSKLLLCYSNRAEAWLRLDEFEKTVLDADKALELDAEHGKSLFRKGKALHGLQRYDECGTCLRKLSAETVGLEHASYLGEP